MKAVRQPVVLTQDLHAHPAVEAWQAVTLGDTVPDRVHVLRESRRGAIYRLSGLGAGGVPVVAKRASISSTTTERIVYQEVLPHVGVTTPRCYGARVEERWGWIFLEDVGGTRYSEAEPAHRVLGGRWLGALHAGAAGTPAARSLPDAGPERYLAHLHRSRDRIFRSLGAWSFPPGHHDVLVAILSQCDTIEAHWEGVVARCGGALPPTMVHCDFQSKNVYVRANGDHETLWVIDWELAGFGPPAADLTHIDLPAYRAEVQREWPDADLDAVERAAAAGRLFQALATLDWASEDLPSDNVVARRDGVIDLELVLRHLPETARSAGVLA